MPAYHVSCVGVLGIEEAAIAVAEETESVVEGVLVALFPGIAYEG